MKESRILGEDLPLPPECLFERLAQIPDYCWDTTIEPTHSSYDNWHVTGIRIGSDHDIPISTSSSSARSKDSFSTHTSNRVAAAGLGAANSNRQTLRTSLSFSDAVAAFHDTAPPLAAPASMASVTTTAAPPTTSAATSTTMKRTAASTALSSPIPTPLRSPDIESPWCPVIARVSSNVVRLEREFHMITSLIKTSDPECKHTIRPIDIIRLAPQPGDSGPLIATLYEYYGDNYLKGLVPFGPAVFQMKGERRMSEDTPSTQVVPLRTFFTFALGACECLELLHYGLKAIHGEIRADAFHFNEANGQVRIFNTGNGARSFDNALGEGWITLSREVGVKNKLQFIAPEQTGRLPIEPDTRTDIYALGVLFYSMLAGHPAFDGDGPVEIVQNVLSKKLPPLSSIRSDIPEPLSAVLAKMTQKQMGDRYHTITSVKHDLANIRKLIDNNDEEGLNNFTIAQRDVSSFFTLPAVMVGRKAEFDKILSVVHRAHRRLQASIAANRSSLHPMYALTSGLVTSSDSSSRYDNFDMCDASTDSESNRNAPSAARSDAAGDSGPLAADGAPYSISPHHRPSLPLMRKKSTTDARLLSSSGDRDNASPRHSLTPYDSITLMERKRAHSKYRHGGCCEVITISGSSGIGKTDLVTRLQPEIRKYGYACTARLDRGRREPYEPFIKVLASLLRQIFSERDITTPYHAAIRLVLQPTWQSLYPALDLPEQLIYPAAMDPIVLPPRPSSLPILKEDDQTSGGSGVISSPSMMLSSLGQTGKQVKDLEEQPQPARGKLVRFADTFVDVLRALSLSKLLCLCLDDVQYADAESVQILSRIVERNVRCILILTTGREELVSGGLKPLFHAANNNANVTNIQLGPLDEEELLEYLSAAVHQPARKSLTPLASVVQALSHGNPFYIRMLLQQCYRKGCIWYSWKDSTWQYDVEKILKECVTSDLDGPLGTQFIAKAFGDTKAEGRSILLWASMLESPFSFSLVQRLLSGEYLQWVDGHVDDMAYDGQTRFVQPKPDVVTAGLQYLLQCGILIPGETDDEYRFAHDHYSQALSIMTSPDMREKMHFVIALTLMNSCPVLQRCIYSCARHISLAASLIRRTVRERKKYRDVLHNAASTAAQSEAKPTALEYLETCIFLLQDDPWDTDAEDVCYEETRDIYLETAEMLELLHRTDRADDILTLLFEKAQTSICKVRAWLLKSKILLQADDQTAALEILYSALDQLGVKIHLERTWDECDQLWRNLGAYLSKTELPTLFGRMLTDDAHVQAIGAILKAAINISFYCDPKVFLILVIEMMNQYIFRGAFSQSAFMCIAAANVAFGRYKDLELGSKLADMSRYCKDQVNDTWSQVSGPAIYIALIDHMQAMMAQTLMSLEEALEEAYLSGDTGATALNTICMGHVRFALGHDMPDLDAMMTLLPRRSDPTDNHRRSMVHVLSIRQAARALQGKTSTDFPEHILTDNDHNSIQYIEKLGTGGQFIHSLAVYRAFQVISLYHYGHYDAVIGIGYSMLNDISYMFTLRSIATIHFYLALALLTIHLDDPSLPDLEPHLEQIRRSKAEVDYYRKACEANYGMWSLILEALLQELENVYSVAMRTLENALDHCQMNGFAMEEALILELQANMLLRGGGKSPAQAILSRAVSAWNRIGASGKARQLLNKYHWLLRVNPPFQTNDVGCQTVDSLLNLSTKSVNHAVDTNMLYKQVEEERPHPADTEEQTSDSTIINEKPSAEDLDILDHYSILEFSQVISSELEIGKLLPKMANIILGSCNSAELAVVITEYGPDNWCVSATADRELGVRTFQEGLEMAEFDDLIALNITCYTLRTREQVLVSNVLEDERFFNVSPSYAARNPEGKSIIALPIIHANKMLGAIHIEGKPQTFTRRNLTVLRLIVMQVGISLANAFLFEESRKVSAANAAMVEAQKRALAHAREAEQKAKVAEAEARRNVKLKEDAAKAKSIFLANISHDLRTPMNGVIGLSELLKGTQLDAQQDGYVESIRVCADTLLTLINDILDFSKLEAGKMKISAVPINLRGSIAEVVRALRYTHRDRDLETIEDLSGIDPNLVVVSDPVRLHQIFMNLLSNSYKFTPKGSVSVRAKAEENEDGKVHVTCVVSDTGIGIGQEQMARLFRPFSQADSSTERSYGGSGLGLSICKAIIENMLGGKIDLQSETGVGTSVTFHLVFNKAVIGTEAQITWSSDLAPDPRPLQVRRTARDLRLIPRNHIRVCIAEDNPINQKIAVTFVRNLGLQCEAYSNGQQAVDALRSRAKEGKPFHLVLMDVQMPILDGYNATRVIREDDDPYVNNVLVIAMTASAIEGDKEKCIDAGMNNYLAKPVRSDVLKSMLDKYLAPQEEESPQRPALRRPMTAPTNQEMHAHQENGNQMKSEEMIERFRSSIWSHPLNRNSQSAGEFEDLDKLSRLANESNGTLAKRDDAESIAPDDTSRLTSRSGERSVSLNRHRTHSSSVGHIPSGESIIAGDNDFAFSREQKSEGTQTKGNLKEKNEEGPSKEPDQQTQHGPDK